MGALYNPLDEIDKTAVTGILKGNGATISAAVSGTDIKTVNSTSMLGAGNVAVQETLVSGTNIKTLGGASLLGAGNIVLSSGALVYLSTVTAAAASTVDIETGFSATYDDYVVIGDNITMDFSDYIVALLKIGGSYLTANYYGCGSLIFNSATYAGEAVTNAAAGPRIAFADPDTNASLIINLFNTNAVKKQTVMYKSASGDGSSACVLSDGVFQNFTAGALTGIRLKGTGATTISGTFKLYGIAKA